MTKQKKIQIIIYSILVVIIGFLIYDNFSQKEVNNNLSQKIELATYQRDSISFELNQIMYEYDQLKVTSNERYQRRIELEKVTISNMLTEIKKLKTANRQIISRYKKQVGTLRVILKSYISTVDSLNTLTKVQQKEIFNLKGDIKYASKKNKKLSKKFSSLNDRVTEASQLEVVYVKAEPVKKNGKSTKKARKTKRIKTNLIIKENVIAKKGTYSAFVVIQGPTGEILSYNNDIIKINKEDIVYSAKRDVEYDGENTKVEIWWEAKSTLVKGTYRIQVYFDNRPVGNTELKLK